MKLKWAGIFVGVVVAGFDTYIAQQLSRIKGVGLIDLHGEQKPAIRVQIDPG